MNGRIAWVTVPLASVGQNNVEAFHRLLSEQVKHVKGVHRGIGFTCNQAKRCDVTATMILVPYPSRDRSLTLANFTGSQILRDRFWTSRVTSRPDRKLGRTNDLDREIFSAGNLVYLHITPFEGTYSKTCYAAR